MTSFLKLAAATAATLLSAQIALAEVPPPLGTPGGSGGSGGGSVGGSTFAAIAYSRTTGSYGYASAYPTYDQAVQGAMGACYQRANDCELAIWVQDGCVALASDAQGFWGVAYVKGLGGITGAHASFDAINDCRTYSNGQSPCTTRIVRCSSDR